MEPLQVLFETPDLPGTELPAQLGQIYGGGLALPGPLLYANFVSSLDGVVALGSPGVSSGSAISGRSEADRFLMGLLRASASAVLVGAGTVRADRGHLWTPGHVYPPARQAFAELRARLGLAPEPLLVVLTAGGDLDPGERALEQALIVTTGAGEARLRGRLPASTRLRALGDRRVPSARVLELLRSEGHLAVLTEGGPSLLGQLVAEGLLDELFLTVSPVLAGRADRAGPVRDARGSPVAGAARLGLVEGVELLPGPGAWCSLRSLRRHGSHLFLRLALGGSPGGRLPQPGGRSLSGEE